MIHYHGGPLTPVRVALAHDASKSEQLAVLDVVRGACRQRHYGREEGILEHSHLHRLCRLAPVKGL